MSNSRLKSRDFCILSNTKNEKEIVFELKLSLSSSSSIYSASWSRGDKHPDVFVEKRKKKLDRRVGLNWRTSMHMIQHFGIVAWSSTKNANLWDTEFQTHFVLVSKHHESTLDARLEEANTLMWCLRRKKKKNFRPPSPSEASPPGCCQQLGWTFPAPKKQPLVEPREKAGTDTCIFCRRIFFLLISAIYKY